MLEKNRTGGEKLFTLPFISITLISLVSGIYSIMLMTTVLMYGSHVGYSSAAAGLLTSSYAFASLFMRPFTGYLSDRFSKKRLCLIGLAGYILAALTFVFAQSYFLYLGVRILSGAAMALASTASGAIVSQVIPPSRFTEGIGFYGIGMTLGAAIAPAIGLWLIENLGYQGMFLVSAGGSAAAFLLMLTIPDMASSREQAGGFCLKGLLQGMYEPSAVFASVSTLLITVAQVSVSQFLPFYGEAKGVPDVSVFFVISAVGVLIPRIGGGVMKRWISDRGLLIAGYLVLTGSYFLLYSTRPAGVLMWVIALLYGLGHGTSNMVLNSMAIIHAPPEKIGAANATYWASGDLGYAIAPIAWGAYCGAQGYLDIYLLSAGIAAISLVAYCFKSMHIAKS